ncbi:DUF2059 domain-containing protein [Mucilaginibacter sp. FT3.2]|uniref:DUF2059 domain-containing protein n=1 Tax=Mucilaginibacter sp. FT3.2 TaxID=2723090 RepID=UPI00160B0199|nr:DUF2059 domain-containing protein [Mucilaginibacter sp. FT3.2]MBB6232328.1 hypothetical protein [Mucilaginibacter sp. FT3.2]
MKFKPALIALIWALLFSTASVNAQTTSTTFTPSHLKSAEQFLIATGINTQFNGMIENMIGASTAQIPEAKREAFIDVMKKFMSKYYSWDVLKDDLAKMYAAEFTEDELNQLTTFYNSPLGKKVGSKTPVLMQKGVALGQQTIANHRPELEQMMKDAFEKKDTPAKQ